MKQVLRYIITSLLFAASISCKNASSPANASDSVKPASEVRSIEPGNTHVNVELDYSNLDSARQKAWLLVPGKSAGLTRLNDNAEKVYQKLGPPDGGDAAMQKAVAIWYTNHDSTNHSVAIYTQRQTEGNAPPALIKQIRITSPTFKTAEGIGPGSNLNQVKNAFAVKQTEQYDDEGTRYEVYDSPQGIAFEIGPGSNCVAIVLHEAGVTGQGTYLKFRTTNRFLNRKKV